MRYKGQPTQHGIGDTAWLMSLTGWTHDKVARLSRIGQIKGAFQAQPNTRGSCWFFRKATTLAWLQSLEVKPEERRTPLAIGWPCGQIPEFY
jgi:hypothetical protein